MFVPLFAPAHLPGLIISGSLVLAAAVVFATTGPETHSDSHERHSKSRHGRNNRSVFWWKGARNSSRAKKTSREREEGSTGGAAHARPCSLPREVLGDQAAKERRRKALKDRAGGPWASDAQAGIAEAAVLLPHEIPMTLEDVIGLDNVVKDMRQRVVLPLLRHDADTLPNNTLLHGPSGCGKRTLALAVAREARAVFLDASAALDHWHGSPAEGTALIWAVAQALQPAVVYAEGVESMLGMLRTAATDAAPPPNAMAMGRGYSGGSGNDVVLIGGTQDMASLGAEAVGQFQLQYSVPMPETAVREALLTRFLFQEYKRLKWGGLSVELWRKGNPRVPGTLTLSQCAAQTQGFSGSALRALVRRTVEIAVDEIAASGSRKGEVTGAHLAQALATFVPFYRS